MSNFFTQIFYVCMNLVKGAAQMMSWLFVPLFELEGVKIAPIGLIGIGAMGIIFTMSLIHLLNPIS